MFDGCSLVHVSGFASSPVEFSLCLSICAPILLCLGLSVLKWKNLAIVKRSVAIASIIAFICSAVFIILIMSRASWIATVAGCAVVCYLHFMSQSKMFRPKAWHVLIGLVLCVLLAFCSYYIKKDSADGRMLIWKISMSELCSGNTTLLPREGNFSTFIGDAQERYFSTEPKAEHEQMIAGAPTAAYNEYLQILIEWGAIPFALTMLMIIFLIVKLYRLHNPESVPWLSGVVSILILCCMSYPLRCIITLHLILFIIGCSLILLVRKNRLRVICQLTMAGVLAFSIVSQIRNSKRIEKAIVQCRRFELVSSQCNPERLRECYHKLYPFLKNEPEYLLSYAKQEYYSGCYKHSLYLTNKAKALSGDPIFPLMAGKCQQAMGNYSQAERSYLKAYYRIPHKIYPLYLLMNMYIETKDHSIAISVARKIVRMKPKIASDEYEYIQREARNWLRINKMSL